MGKKKAVEARGGGFERILRGALHTPPLSNEEIVEKAAAERAARKSRPSQKPSGGSKKGKRSD